MWVGIRVLMLTPDIGILDRRIAQEAATLARAGASVDIYPVFDPLEGEQDGLAPGVRLLQRPRIEPTAQVSAYLRVRGVKRWVRRALPVLHKPLQIVQSLITDMAALSTTEDEALLAAGEPYDVVFAHDSPMLPLATRLAQRWSAAVICDLHEIFPEQHHIRHEWWTYRAMRRMERKYLPLADGILCVNPAVRDYVEQEAPITAPIGVVHNAVPYVERPSCGLSVRDLFGISDGIRVLVFAGSLRRDANLAFLVEAFVHADVSEWALAILGAGPEEASLRQLVSALDAQSRVYLGRRVPQADLVPILSTADAGVLPYVAIDYNHKIATPNKLFEYVQARLPVLSSDLPEVRRIIEASGIGTLADFSTLDSAADAMAGFLSGGIGRFETGVLEAAARELCWERDEVVLVRTCEAAIRSRAAAHRHIRA